jgi:glycosyltransferase 2 family protein
MNDRPAGDAELPAGPLPARRRARAWNAVLGYLLAAVFLAWVFHGIEFGRLFDNVTRISWPLVALGLLFDVLSYICAGWRWHLLLRPVGRVGFFRTTQAIYAGLFLNEVLPMRVGELARAYLVSRWLRTEVLRVVPSMALERLSEGIWLSVGIGLTALSVPLPKNLARSGDVAGLMVLAGVAAFVGYVLWRRRRPAAPPAASASPPNLWHRLRRAGHDLGRGFGEIGLTWNTAAAFCVTFPVFACQAVSFWLMIVAYRIPLPFWAGAAVFLIVHFGTSLPNAPANIGAYQFFCVLGLQLFAVDKTLATGFSFVVFILLTLPLLVIGFFALGQSGLGFRSLRDELRKAAVR